MLRETISEIQSIWNLGRMSTFQLFSIPALLGPKKELYFFFFLLFLMDTYTCPIWSHWYPYFGFLAMSPLGSALFALAEVNVISILWNPPLVLHLLTSWWPVLQPVTSPYASAEVGVGSDSNGQSSAQKMNALPLCQRPGTALLTLFSVLWQIRDVDSLRKSRPTDCFSGGEHVARGATVVCPSVHAGCRLRLLHCFTSVVVRLTHWWLFIHLQLLLKSERHVIFRHRWPSRDTATQV